MNKIQCHGKAGIMPSTHSPEERKNPAIAVVLDAVFYPACSFFVEH
jgi:hypothetical protein